MSWDELRKAVRTGKSEALYFDPEQTLKRVETLGDLFAPVLTLRQTLPAADDAVQRKKPVAVRKRQPQSLSAYRAKRDFTKTAEPPPAAPQRSRQGGRRRFVI